METITPHNHTLCPMCGVDSSNEDWISTSAISVVGYNDPTTVGDIGDMDIRKDPNYFWICPNCDRQVNGGF